MKSYKNIVIFLTSFLFLVLSWSNSIAATYCGGTTGGSYTTYSCEFLGFSWTCRSKTQSSSSSCQWYPGTSDNCGGCVTQSQSCTSSPSGCDINGPSTGAGGCGGTAVWQTNGCNVCTTSCPSGLICGEVVGNGCGGTCPVNTTGLTTWTPWSCVNCGYRGGCGNVNWYEDCTRQNQCNQTENLTQVCGNECHECGPYISNWGGWSACTAPGFSRNHTRTCGEDCGSDSCAGVSTSEDETCYATITGNFFDASLVDTCATYATQDKIAGVAVGATAQANHSTTYPTTTDGAGNYGITVLVPDTYNLTYTVPNTVRYIADPPKLLCDGALTGIYFGGQGDAATRRVGLWRVYGGWFQAQGGVYGNSGITVTIPATCGLAANATTCNSYNSGGQYRTPLIVADTNGNVGTAYSGDNGSVSLGGGSTPASNAVVSNSSVTAASGYAERVQGYNYFIKQGAQYQNTSKTNWNGSGKPSGASNGLYKTESTGTLTIGTGTQPGAGEEIVIFHDGDVSIASDIDVPVGSFLGVIATGSIRVQAGVTRVEGVYVADQNFEVLSSGDENTEVRFVGEGSFVGLTGINLLRTRGVTNNSESSEYFIFRPDFVINSPYGLRLPQYTWREVAP